MRRLLLTLLLCGTVAMAGEKSIFDFTMNSIDGEATYLQIPGQGRAAGQRREPLRVYAAVRSARKSLRKIQRSWLRDRRNPGEQFRRPGTGLEPGNQNVLFREIQRHLPDDGKSFCKRW